MANTNSRTPRASTARGAPGKKNKNENKTENKTENKRKTETKNRERSLTLKGGFGMTSKGKSKGKN
jgi:hypothetical protein